jgi:hypothetical protein
MNSETNNPRKLHWWFWLLLFAPGLFSVIATAGVGAFMQGGGEQQLSGLVVANIFVGLPVNGICSACCAVHLNRVRTGAVSPGRVIVATLGFFVLNLILSFAGCAAGAGLGDSIRK